MRILQAFQCCLTALLFLSFSTLSLAENTFVKAGLLVDPLSGGVVEDPLVEIDGERIVTVTSGGSAAEGATVIDLGDATILPGLADMHTHLP